MSGVYRALFWTNLKDAVKLGCQFLLTVARGRATPGRLALRHADGVSEQLANVNYLQRNTHGPVHTRDKTAVKICNVRHAGPTVYTKFQDIFEHMPLYKPRRMTCDRLPIHACGQRATSAVSILAIEARGFTRPALTAFQEPEAVREITRVVSEAPQPLKEKERRPSKAQQGSSYIRAPVIGLRLWQ